MHSSRFLQQKLWLSSAETVASFSRNCGFLQQKPWLLSAETMAFFSRNCGFLQQKPWFPSAETVASFTEQKLWLPSAETVASFSRTYDTFSADSDSKNTRSRILTGKNLYKNISQRTPPCFLSTVKALILEPFRPYC